MIKKTFKIKKLTLRAVHNASGESEVLKIFTYNKEILPYGDRPRYLMLVENPDYTKIPLEVEKFDMVFIMSEDQFFEVAVPWSTGRHMFYDDNEEE